MNKFSKIVSSIAGKIQSSFLKIRPYKIISLKPKEHVIHLIVFRNGKILALVRRGYESILNYFNIYLYDNEDNYSTPQKYEFDCLDLYDKDCFVSFGIYCSFELENEDLIICYGNQIEIRKKVNNIYSLIKKISYREKFSKMKTKKLKNNRFIVGREFSITIQLWAKNNDDNNYECIFETRLPTDMYYSQFINKNLFNIEINNKIWFYKHDFNDNNNKIKIMRYKSKEIYKEILDTYRYEDETINVYNFKCEVICKLEMNIGGKPIGSYKNFFYYLDTDNKEIYAINVNTFKVQKYYIDFNIKNYEPLTLKFISNEKILIGYNKIIEYKLNTKNNKFLRSKTCSENKSSYYGGLINGNNGDLIYYGDRILFFSKKDLLND